MPSAVREICVPSYLYAQSYTSVLVRTIYEYEYNYYNVVCSKFECEFAIMMSPVCSLNLLRSSEEFLDSEALEAISSTSELNYLTNIVVRLYDQVRFFFKYSIFAFFLFEHQN